MQRAVLIIDDDDNDDMTNKIIDHIADNIDQILDKFDIRILAYKELAKAGTKMDIRSLPCLHVDGINYHGKRDIFNVLNTGKAIVSDNLNNYDNILRELHELPKDELISQVNEEDIRDRLEQERSERIMKDADRRKAQPPKPNTIHLNNNDFNYSAPVEKSKVIESISGDMLLEMLRES